MLHERFFRYIFGEFALPIFWHEKTDNGFLMTLVRYRAMQPREFVATACVSGIYACQRL